MCTHTRCAHAFGSMRKLCVYTYECIVLYVLAVCQLTQCIEAHVIATWIFMRMRALFRLLSPVCADTQPHTQPRNTCASFMHARAHTHKKYTKTKARVEWTNVCVATVLVRSQSRVVFGWLGARKYESACNKLLHFCCQSLSTSETLTHKKHTFCVSFRHYWEVVGNERNYRIAPGGRH